MEELAMAIKLRGNTFYLYRRVPQRFQSVDDRTFVWVSLHTDSRQHAEQKAALVWQELIEGWEARRDGLDGDAEQRFKAAQDIAQRLGFGYRTIKEVAILPVNDILDRVEAIPSRPSDEGPQPDKLVASAMLGSVPEPGISISKALEMYWGFTRDAVLKKSSDQVRRWRNPRIKAIKNFVAVIGDKDIEDITRDDMLSFRDWWMDRLEMENLTSNSANKDLIHLGSVLKTVVEKKALRLDLPLSGLSFKEDDSKKRPAFSTEWIRNKILAPGALSGLNTEARGILLGMINTGYRPSEGAALTAGRIRLDHDIPHIEIAQDTREVKSRRAKRKIPLVGVSLLAFQEHSEGFPRYNDNPGLSGTLNKYLRENGLTETPKHTAYGLRHNFEDRMLAARIDDRIRRDLIGHRLNREEYGEGATLKHTQELLMKLAL